MRPAFAIIPAGIVGAAVVISSAGGGHLWAVRDYEQLDLYDYGRYLPSQRMKNATNTAEAM